MNKTLIFKNYEEFLKREDKSINGVSQDFAEKNPNFVNNNMQNIGCWNCKNCACCNSCIWCVNCFKCQNCENCERCTSCSDCRTTYNCEYCSDLTGENGFKYY